MKFKTVVFAIFAGSAIIEAEACNACQAGGASNGANVYNQISNYPSRPQLQTTTIDYNFQGPGSYNTQLPQIPQLPQVTQYSQSTQYIQSPQYPQIP